MVEYVWVLVVLAAPMVLGVVIAVRQWLAIRSDRRRTTIQGAEIPTKNNH